MNKFSHTEKGWDGVWYAYCTDGWCMNGETEDRAKERLEEKLKEEE